MVTIFESVEEMIELRESFLDVPFVVPHLKLNIEEDSPFLSLILAKTRDANLDSRC